MRNQSHPQEHRLQYYDVEPKSNSPRRGSYIDVRGRSPPRNEQRNVLHYNSRSRSSSRGHGVYHDRSDEPKPSKEIMLEDLALHVTEKDIRGELQQHYHVEDLVDVRVIRDRQSRGSRGFGFIKFRTVQESQNFMDKHYPSIYIYGDASAAKGQSSAKVRINFCRERKQVDREQDADWNCPSCHINNFSSRPKCFRCHTNRPEYLVSLKSANVGDNDAAPESSPSQFLLFRGLDVSVTEELFAKGVLKLSRSDGTDKQEKDEGFEKGYKIGSTTTDGRLGAKDGSLRRVLLVRDRVTDESWMYGFAEYATISDAQAAMASFASHERFTIASKKVVVSYIHAGVFVPVHDIHEAEDRFLFNPLGNSHMKLAYWDEDAYVTEHILSMSILGLGRNKKENTSEITEATKTLPGLEKLRKRKQQLENSSSLKKATPSHLQFWSNRHAELHGIKTVSEQAKSSAGTNVSSKSFADPTRNCCYLCMRQFKTSTEVNKHERLSAMHRDNLKNELKIRRAEHKLEKHKIGPTTLPTAFLPSTEAPEYRDRAKERRQVYGVVNKKGEQVGPQSRKSRSPSPPPQLNSKGAGLLAKMGYSGAGLGADGGGMTAPISQNVYAAGVGLGAQGGNLGSAVEEAERNTKNSYSVWTDQVKDRARERFQQM